MTARLVVLDAEAVGARAGGGDPMRCRWFAIALFAAGVAAGAGLIASGQPFPDLGGALLLAVLFAVAVNRVALFPSELAVTAEVAVLLAAIVGFGSHGALVGPWCIAALAGPLDFVHWRQRSFVRMAYNAGNRMAATLAGAAIFGTIVGVAGSSFEANAVAALVASIAFAMVEAAVGTVLMWLYDENPPVRHSRGAWIAAARVELPMERLSVPLGLIGAAAGYLATAVGWWCVVPVLTPTLFLPELAIARRRRPRSPLRQAAGSRLVALVPAALLLAAVGLLAPLPAVALLAGMAVGAALLGLELRADGSVPALVAALVGTAVVIGDGAGYGAGSVVAVATVAVSCAIAGANGWWPPLVAGCSALGAAALYDVRPSRVLALGATFAFELLVVSERLVVRRSARMERLHQCVWTVPLVCAAVSLAYAWRAVGAVGVLGFGVIVGAILVATALFGAPPWSSRVVARQVARVRARTQPSLLLGTALLSLSLGIAACAFEDERVVLVALAAAGAAAVASFAMAGVRQWRFATRARTRDAAVALVCATSVAIAYPQVALDGDVWSVAILAAALAVATAIALPLARLSAASTDRVRAERDAVKR